MLLFREFVKKEFRVEILQRLYSVHKSAKKKMNDTLSLLCSERDQQIRTSRDAHYENILQRQNDLLDAVATLRVWNMSGETSS